MFAFILAVMQTYSSHSFASQGQKAMWGREDYMQFLELH